MRNVEQAARTAVGQQRQQALIADLEASINSPPASPDPVEPEVILVSEDDWGSTQLGPDFNPKKRRW
jgi:hypothetical protein